MKLYISYFYQVRFFPRNLVSLSTVVWPPKYQITDSTGQPALIVDCPPLKPGAACEGLCNGSCAPKHPQNCAFLQTYYKQLQQINMDAFLTHLYSLGEYIKQKEHFDEVNFAIIVFESPKNICSERVMLFRWLQENGVEVEEWSKTMNGQSFCQKDGGNSPLK